MKGLKIRKLPLDKILSGTKTGELKQKPLPAWFENGMEIALCETVQMESGIRRGGVVRAKCKIDFQVELNWETLANYENLHCLGDDINIIKHYKTPFYMYVLSDIQPCESYEYPKNHAVTWINLPKEIRGGENSCKIHTRDEKQKS